MYNHIGGSAGKVKLQSFDSLFGSSPVAEERNQVILVPLTDLHTFAHHPFRVMDDEKMEELKQSVIKHGVLVPGVVRKRTAGGYELIAGHRRKRASELAGLLEMPVIVRNYTEDEATIVMVDSNIQREDILPSEKAKAYKMKFEALKHQGKRAEGTTIEKIGEATGESGKTVQRYICLARLTDELLELVDEKQLSFLCGVDLSYLSVEQQNLVYEVICNQNLRINGKQSERLKIHAQSGTLTQDRVQQILLEVKKEKPKPRKVTIPVERLNQYFPPNFNEEEIEMVIYELLEQWKNNV